MIHYIHLVPIVMHTTHLINNVALVSAVSPIYNRILSCEPLCNLGRINCRVLTNHNLDTSTVHGIWSGLRYQSVVFRTVDIRAQSEMLDSNQNKKNETSVRGTKSRRPPPNEYFSRYASQSQKYPKK